MVLSPKSIGLASSLETWAGLLCKCWGRVPSSLRNLSFGSLSLQLIGQTLSPLSPPHYGWWSPPQKVTWSSTLITSLIVTSRPALFPKQLSTTAYPSWHEKLTMICPALSAIVSLTSRNLLKSFFFPWCFFPDCSLHPSSPSIISLASRETNACIYSVQRDECLYIFRY